MDKVFVTKSPISRNNNFVGHAWSSREGTKDAIEYINKEEIIKELESCMILEDDKSAIRKVCKLIDKIRI